MPKAVDRLEEAVAVHTEQRRADLLGYAAIFLTLPSFLVGSVMILGEIGVVSRAEPEVGVGLAAFSGLMFMGAFYLKAFEVSILRRMLRRHMLP